MKRIRKRTGMTILFALACLGCTVGVGGVDEPTSSPAQSPQPSYFTLSYLAGPHGRIEGPASQTVAADESGQAVTAVADSGYVFSGWSDGSVARTRIDANLRSDLTVTASFAENTGASILFSAEINESVDLSAGNDQGFSRWMIEYLVVTVDGAYLEYEWYLDGGILDDFAGQRTIAIETYDVPLGVHTLTVIVAGADGVPYSKQLRFRVVE